MITLTPKKYCKNIIGINPEEVSYFELEKGSALFSEENLPKQTIIVSIKIKDKKEFNVFYSFSDKEIRDKCFLELKELEFKLLKSKSKFIFAEIIEILNATQRLQ